MEIADKVAVITGGASGLGRATAQLYSEKRAKVVIFDRNQELGEQLVGELKSPAAFKSGLIHTPLFETLDQDIFRALEASVIFPDRLGKPMEIASLSHHIVENDYMNGECIRLDGAIRMQPG